MIEEIKAWRKTIASDAVAPKACKYVDQLIVEVEKLQAKLDRVEPVLDAAKKYHEILRGDNLLTKKAITLDKLFKAIREMEE